MGRVELLACMGLAMSASAWAGCGSGKSELLFEYVSTPPLLVAEADASLVVQVDRDGCAVVHLPAHDLRRGDYRWLLPAADLKRLQVDLDAAVRLGLEQEALRRLEKSTAQDSGMLLTIRDENLVQVRIASVGAKAGPVLELELTRLHEALAHRPGQAEWKLLGTLRDAAEAIADQAVAAARGKP